MTKYEKYYWLELAKRDWNGDYDSSMWVCLMYWAGFPFPLIAPEMDM
jgi:hypothetical protein